MKKKNKLILGATGILGILAIIIPSTLFAESNNYFSYTTAQETNLNSLYCKELTQSDLQTSNNTENAQTQYNNLQTVTTPLVKILNGDLNLNNGNYLVILGDQADIGYQAIAYSNFLTANTLDQYYSNYGSILYNALNSIG